ncbi:MAG TPA: shikimate dehydrogenase [Longimicrobiaceae bacterium]|nr:shikimate dehydrogenase [Longimicrobiaceae bacterium]
MSFAPTSATRVFALLGDPVAHSLSPLFQNAALRAADLDGIYVALRTPAGHLAGVLRGLAVAGGGGNVTVPHKELAARSVDRATEAVRRTRACNTFWLEDGEVRGDNTDVAGAGAALRALLGRAPEGARVLLVGAGGSARAVAAALSRERVGDVVVLNRTATRAEALRADFPELRVSVARDATELAGERFDLAVNATSVGLRPGDALPLTLDSGPRVGAALDLVYTPDETPWVRTLRASGIPAADGIEMLLHQGAAAFERWWGRPAPLDVMRAALPARRAPGP